MKATQQSERSHPSRKPRFPRLQLRSRRAAANLDRLQGDLEDLIAEHRQAGHGWFAAPDHDGMVRIIPS